MAADASVSLGIDFLQFKAGLAQANKTMEQSMKQIRNIVAVTAAAIGVKFSFDAFKSGVEGAIKAGRELDILSKQSGVAAKDISLMTHALDRSGMSTEQTADILKEFHEKMIFVQAGVGNTAGVLSTLGIKLDDLKRKDIGGQFEDLADAVNKIENPMQRMAVATTVFGQQGAKAVAAFQSGDVANAAKLFGKNAEMEAKASQQLARVGVSFDRIKTAGMIIFGNIAAKLGPILEYAASKLEGVLPLLEDTISKWIDGAKMVVLTLYNAFKGGALGEILWLGFQIATMKFIDLFLGLSKGAFLASGEILGQVLSLVGTLDFWSGMGKAMIGTFDIALGAFIDKLSAPLKFLQDGLTYVFESTGEFFHKIMASSVGKVIKVLALINPAAAAIRDVDKVLGNEKARTLPQIQAAHKEFEVGGVTGKDLIGAGKSYFKESGKDFTEAINQAGLSAQAVIDKFSEGYESAGIFGDELAEKMKLIKDLVAKFMPEPSKEKQGEGEKKKGTDGFKIKTTGTFDDFRKIGGGAGNAVNNIPQRQLDRLSEIKSILARDSKGAQFTKTNSIIATGGY